VIEGLVPLLGRPSPGSALWELADGWKTKLGVSTSQEATYLQVALLQWERDHNLHPDLASRVELFVDEGAGTVLLMGGQVDCLGELLDHLDIRGRARVALGASGAHLRSPGAELVLHVGDHTILVPADRHTSLRRVDGAVVGYFFVATIIPFATEPTNAALPWSAALAGIGLCLAAGWWCHARLRAYGPTARQFNLRCAIVVALVLTASFSVTMRHPYTIDGDSNIIGLGLPLLSIVGAAYYGSSRRLRRQFVAGVIATCLTAIILFPDRVTVLAVAETLDWNLVLYFPVWFLIGRSLDRAQEEHAKDSERADSEAVLEAFHVGQEEVVSLVRRARDDARSQLAANVRHLNHDDADLVRLRLTEVDRRLELIAG
jgi:hypothetical protein